MKKVLSIVAIVVFFAAIAMPVSAMTDDKPAKKAKTEAKKDCATPCGEKKAAPACGEKKAPACDEKKAPACGEKEKK